MPPRLGGTPGPVWVTVSESGDSCFRGKPRQGSARTTDTGVLSLAAQTCETVNILSQEMNEIELLLLSIGHILAESLRGPDSWAGMRHAPGLVLGRSCGWRR